MTQSKRRYPILILLLIGSSFLCGLSAQNNLDLHDKRVLILGDSITHRGTYVSFISYFLQKRYPDLDYDIISIGLGSETAAGTSEADHPFPRPCIHSRLDHALEQTKPDIVFACYGMNDGIYHPFGMDRFLAYQSGIESLVAKVHASNAEVVLLTPPPFDADAKKSLAPPNATDFSYKAPFAQYNDVLRTYGKWIMIAKLSTARKIDLNTPMLEYNRQRRKIDPQFHLANDGIHPNELGHLLMAKTILQACGFEFEGDIIEILEQATADPLFVEIDHRRQMRSKGWLEYIGYERGEVVKTESVLEIEIEAAERQKSIDKLRRL